MGILDEDVKTVRERSDLVAIASQYTQLKRVGRRMQGLCPFHSEKSGSFYVNAEEGLYKCFGCGVGGDVITFVREMEHLDFVGAVEWLAGKSGVTLRYTDRNEGESRRKRDRLVEGLEKVVDWYHTRLLESPDAAVARKYLRSRGFDGEQVREYLLGWAPDGWDVMVRSVGLPRDVLVDTGVGLVNKRNRLQDFFRGRVLFPIFDAQGRPVSFGGRVLPGHEDGPKYMNTADTALYQKSKTLYGLSWHKDPIVRAEEVIVCEGYTDVIACAQAGLPRAVATCGTALTADHVRSMKRFAQRIVLAFDADSAGQSAAARVYEWERTFDVDVAVADLPQGVDPADLARSDPERLQAAIEGATPMLGFRVDRALRSTTLDSPEGRARAAAAALEVIAEHPSDLIRDQYLMDVAARCRMTPERLREIAARPARRSSRDDVVDVRDVTNTKARPSIDDSPEMEILRLGVSRPSEVFSLADPALLADGVMAEAYEALSRAGSVREAMDRVSPSAAELLGRVAVEETDAEPEDVLARLLDRAASAALDEVEAEARSSDDPLGYAPITAWLKMRIESLRLEPDVRDEETVALRDWIIDRVNSERGAHEPDDAEWAAS